MGLGTPTTRPNDEVEKELAGRISEE
jgi:hypothetical protein